MPNDDLAPLRANQKYCFSCAAPLHVSAEACPVCGARQPQIEKPAALTQVAPSGALSNAAPMLRANQVFCRSCGQPVSNLAPYCPHCGAPQVGTQPCVSKNKYVAAAFAFFLGGFGVHKFYLGEVGLGVLYLLFCWTFIPAIVAFIECIFYLASSDESFARRYG